MHNALLLQTSNARVIVVLKKILPIFVVICNSSRKMEEEVIELFSLLPNDDKLSVNVIALDYILSLTGNNESLKLFNDPSRLSLIIYFLKSPTAELAMKASLILINISASENGPKAILEVNDICKKGSTTSTKLHHADPIYTILQQIVDTNSTIADSCCKILSNLTRSVDTIEKVVTLIQESGVNFEDLLNIFVQIKYNLKGNTLEHLGSVVGHLCQSNTFCSYILDKEKFIVQKILPFTEYHDSHIKRRAAAVALKNCCFHTEHHEWLLSDEVDILSALLLPLTGNTQFDDEDNDKFPFALQYLPDDKERESHADIRCLLLEALTQLCALRKNRDFLRNKNAGAIIRDLYKWEKLKQHEKTFVACGNLLEILLRDETDIECDNLKDVAIPNDFDPTSTTSLIDTENIKNGGWIKM